MVTYDDAGNVSEMSNVVLIYAGEVAAETTTEEGNFHFFKKRFFSLLVLA